MEFASVIFFPTATNGNLSYSVRMLIRDKGSLCYAQRLAENENNSCMKTCK
jgi:hypothetical protein